MLIRSKIAGGVVFVNVEQYYFGFLEVTIKVGKDLPVQSSR